jgi:hypothetical protein
MEGINPTNVHCKHIWKCDSESPYTTNILIKMLKNKRTLLIDLVLYMTEYEIPFEVVPRKGNFLYSSSCTVCQISLLG